MYAAGPRLVDSVRLGREGIMIPRREYVVEENGSVAQIDVERILALYRSGASLILNGLHDASAPIAELCALLSRFFGVKVHANAYLTPAGARGFPLHSDAHDVILLQVAGSKEWAVHAGRETALLRTSVVPADDVPPPDSTSTHLCLRAGEALYLPRGHLHRGTAGRVTSFHLTIGLEAYTWSDLIRDVVADLEGGDVAFRRSVPPRLGAPDLPDEQLRTVEELTRHILDPQRVRTVWQARAGELTTRPVPGGLRGRFAEAFRVGEISTETKVRARHGIELVVDEGADQRLLLRFADKALTLPRFTEPQLRVLGSGSPLCVADLPAGLDPESTLVLVRRLVLDGLLEVLG